MPLHPCSLRQRACRVVARHERQAPTWCAEQQLEAAVSLSDERTFLSRDLTRELQPPLPRCVGRDIEAACRGS